MHKCRFATWSRRHWIGSIGAAVGAFALTPAPPHVSRGGSVMQFGADPSGTKDSTPAFTKAINRFDIVNVPAGTFLVHNLPLRAGLTLAGAGEASVLRPKAGPGFALLCDSGSADPASNLRGIVVRNVQLRGSCDTDGFAEHQHLASLNGVSDVTFHNVVFRGFRGDGLYIGSGWNSPKAERHNRNILVRSCTFDGINHQNRNGISVIDCDGLAVEKCRFVRVAREDMPGSIDLEPDQNAFHVIRNIRIADNTFIDSGGTVVGFTAPVRLIASPHNILIENNAIDGARTQAFGFVQLYPLTPHEAPEVITVRNNRIGGTFGRPFWLRGVAGVEFRGNQFDGASQSALIGDAEGGVRAIVLSENIFRNCGTQSGSAVSVSTVEDVQFIDNQWIDCGNGKPDSCAIAFVGGASQGVSFARNRFSSPTVGRMQFAIRKEPAHHFDAKSNAFVEDNTVAPGLRNAFEARGLRTR